MVRRFPVPGQRPESPRLCTKSASSPFLEGLQVLAIAKTNFLELEIALWVRVGSTKDFKPYAEDES